MNCCCLNRTGQDRIHIAADYSHWKEGYRGDDGFDSIITCSVIVITCIAVNYSN